MKVFPLHIRSDILGFCGVCPRSILNKKEGVHMCSPYLQLQRSRVSLEKEIFGIPSSSVTLCSNQSLVTCCPEGLTCLFVCLSLCALPETDCCPQGVPEDLCAGLCPHRERTRGITASSLFTGPTSILTALFLAGFLDPEKDRQ